MGIGRHGSFSGQISIPANPLTAASRSQSIPGLMVNNPNRGGAPPPPPARPTDPRFRGNAPDTVGRPPFGDAPPPPPPPPPAGPSPAQQYPLMPPQSDGPYSPRPPPVFRGNSGGCPPLPPPSDSSSFRALEEPDNAPFRRDSFRLGGGPPEGGPALGDSGRNNSFQRGPPMPPQQRRGPSEIPELPGSDSSFRPALARDNSFRGGRRGSDFRGGGGEAFRGGPSDVPLFRGGGGGGGDYYGPAGGGEFRRSPSRGFGRGGLGGLPPPPISRQASFQHRRNDPRFATKEPPDVQHQPDQRPPDHYQPDHYQPDQRPPFEGQPPEDAGKPISFGGSFHRKPSSLINRSASDSGDAFGRTRERFPNRPSPQASPQDRKPVLKFFQHSPNDPPPPMAPVFAASGLAPAPQLDSGPAVASSAAASLPEQSVVVDEQPPPLLSSALGEDLMGRAEKIIAEVGEILGCATSLKAAEDPLSKLPSKQQILQAVAKMDARIKKLQKAVEETKRGVAEALRDEEEQRQRAEDDAIEEAKRLIDERVCLEEEKRLEEAREHESEIQSFVGEKKSIFDEEQKKILMELEAKLKVAKDDEERKMREALNEQMINTADNFDKDIVKKRKERERATHISKRTEARLADIENDYREKLKQAENEGVVDTSPKPTDVVSTIIAENRRRAAEAHLNQLTFLSHDDELPMDNLATKLQGVKDPTAEKTTAEWSQMAKQVTGLADALYSEPSEAPYFAHNEKTHDAIAPLIQAYICHKQNRLKKHWMQLAEEYEYRKTLYDKQLHSGTPAKDKPRKSLSIPVRHSILQGGKPNQPIMESAGARTSTNPYRRPRRGNEVRSEYEQEQIIAEIAAKEALEKRITFGGTDLPRQIGQLERELTGHFINTFTSQRVDLVEQERELSNTNVWSDMEKAIFLDRYVHLSL